MSHEEREKRLEQVERWGQALRRLALTEETIDQDTFDAIVAAVGAGIFYEVNLVLSELQPFCDHEEEREHEFPKPVPLAEGGP